MSKRKITRNYDDIKKKIKDNNDECNIAEDELKMLRITIGDKEKETKAELDSIIKAFQDKHGLTPLYNLRSRLVTKITNCKGNKKYGGCTHPKKSQVRASRGWSGSWRCTICNYEDIDEYGPGN